MSHSPPNISGSGPTVFQHPSSYRTVGLAALLPFGARYFTAAARKATGLAPGELHANVRSRRVLLHRRAGVGWGGVGWGWGWGGVGVGSGGSFGGDPFLRLSSNPKAHCVMAPWLTRLRGGMPKTRNKSGGGVLRKLQLEPLSGCLLPSCCF